MLIPQDRIEADFIVVGAGSAGCAVAARLSEDPGTRVLLLEPGGEGRNRWIHIPLGFGKTFADPSVNWCYETEPDPGAGDRRVYWPRGKVLGGSSSINGMVYIRGQAEDFDHWRQLGNTGWSFDHVRPHFKTARGQTRVPGRQHRLVVRRRAALFQTRRAPDARRRRVPRHRGTALRLRCSGPSPDLRSLYRGGGRARLSAQ